MAIIVLLSIGAVSAADNGTDNSLSASNQNLLSADPGTFTDLQNEIDGNISSGTMELTRDYVCVDADNLKEIVINGKITINGNNHTLDASHKHGIFNINASDVILNNITFINANASDFDLYRAVNVNGDNCVINNSYFYGNTMSSVVDKSQGGAIYWAGDDGALINSVFADNSVASRGDDGKNIGGAIFWAGDNGNMTNCTFRNNFAVSGGAVSWGNKNLTPKKGLIYRCNFDNNSVLYHGMALYSSCINLTIIESNFTNNTGSFSAVLIEDNAPNVNISYCIFNENKAIANDSFVVGGYVTSAALELMGYGANVEYCNFTSNIVKSSSIQDSYTGAVKVHSNADDSVIDHCNFINNTADRYGAIEWICKNGILKYSNFINNTALTDNAGAVQWSGSNGTVLECIFENNTAGYCGGAICWNGNSGSVSQSIFENNTVAGSSYVYGGAIFFDEESTDSRVINSNFTANRAVSNGRGGAIYWLGVSGNVSQSIFEDNTAGVYGGAIYFSGDDATTVDSIFKNNTANEDAGAIYWRGVSGNVSQSIFENNTANSNGGAIYFDSNSKNSKVIDSSFFNNSVVNENGGAIQWNSPNGTVYKSNFTANRAGPDDIGGAIYWRGVSGNVSQSIFENNTAGANGGAIRY